MVRFSPKSRTFLRTLKPPQWMWRSAGFIAIKLLNTWMGTLNYRVWRHDPAADPGDVAFSGPAIFVFWHEYIPLPIYLRPNCRLAMLLSQHQDAEVLSHIAHYAGMEAVRGSTSRGGTTALRALIERGQGMSLAITPDGPRGPRRKLAQGCVYVSSRLQIPIIPIGFGYDRPWRNKKTWDQFAIPRPFSKARAVLGPRIQVPAGLERDDIEQHRVWIEKQLVDLTELAELWALGRYNLRGNEPLFRTGPKSIRSIGGGSLEASVIAEVAKTAPTITEPQHD
jgi:lysophospholipid acyltransferase (LPLAT)-like uncharacterized protein